MDMDDCRMASAADMLLPVELGLHGFRAAKLRDLES
jgi:hypothetical protein